MTGTIRELFDLEFTLLSGVATTSGWEFELRFPDGAAASEFKTFLNERAIPHDLRRLYRLSTIPQGATELTDEQREALLVAYQCGHFNEPRDATLSELADQLVISPSSVSGRLRQGYEVLVESATLSELHGRNGETNANGAQRI